MLDVKRIRNDFDALAEKLATRGVAAETLNELKELDVKRRELLIKSEELKAQRNIASDGIAQAKRNKEDASEQIAAMQKVSAEIKEIDAELAASDEKLNAIVGTLPNTPNAIKNEYTYSQLIQLNDKLTLVVGKEEEQQKMIRYFSEVSFQG